MKVELLCFAALGLALADPQLLLRDTGGQEIVIAALSALKAQVDGLTAKVNGLETKVDDLARKSTPAPRADTCTVWKKVQTLPASGLTNFAKPSANSPTGVYKITNNKGQALFIEDNNPAWNGYDWQSNDPSNVRCATSESPSWKSTAAAISCNSKGVGSHTCGYGNGWIMFHNGETYGTNTPCKIGQTTTNGWGRGQFVNVYSCTSFA
eukprot:g332.t1